MVKKSRQQSGELHELPKTLAKFMGLDKAPYWKDLANSK